MIRTEGLCKRFDRNGHAVNAVEALDLQVKPGEVFGFLGPNGAGKTTTVRMLACLIAPTAGRASVNGLDITRDAARIRPQIGIMTESPGLYERLSARHNLAIYAELYGVSNVAGQVEKYLRLLELWDARDRPAAALSKGMKQKVAIARALLHEPPVVFLDEPTSSLDPEATKTVHDFLKTLKNQGRTIFLCTHNLAEAEELCDRIAVFKTRLIAVDTPEALRRHLYGRQTVIQVAGPAEPLVDELRRLPFIRQVACSALPESPGDGTLTISMDDPATHVPDVLQALVAQGARVRNVTELKHSLEEVYLDLVHTNGSGKENV